MLQKQNRVLSYDIIRIAAILLVVLAHTAAPFVQHNSPPAPDFLWGNLFDSLARSSVPLFVMLSGALLLDEDRPLPAGAVARRIGSTLLLLVTWSFLYALVYQVLVPLSAGRAVSLRAFGKALLLGHFHLWFLYMLLGLYLVTPLLRLFVKKENSRYILYFVALSAVFQFAVPPVSLLADRLPGLGDTITALAARFEPGFASTRVSYFLLGWYLAHHSLHKRCRLTVYLLGALGLLVTFSATQLLTTADCRAYGVFYSDNSLNVLPFAAASFLWLHTHFTQKQPSGERLPRFLARASSLVFGVYAVHIFILDALTATLFAGRPGSFIPVIWLCTAALSFLAVFVLSKLPLVRRLVRC